MRDDEDIYKWWQENARHHLDKTITSDLPNILPLKGVRVLFKKLNPDAKTPQYTREADACMDLYSSSNVYLDPFITVTIGTGIALEIPKGYEGLVRGRSGLSAKGYLVHLGTIDYEYRGEIGVVITNLSEEPRYIAKHTRIAQFTIKPVIKIDLHETSSLSETQRGDSNYGSSGLY